MTTLELNAQDLAKRITVEIHIKGMTKWRWRLRIATWLIQLAVRISGMGIEFVDDEGISA